MRNKIDSKNFLLEGKSLGNRPTLPVVLEIKKQVADSSEISNEETLEKTTTYEEGIFSDSSENFDTNSENEISENENETSERSEDEEGFEYESEEESVSSEDLESSYVEDFESVTENQSYDHHALNESEKNQESFQQDSLASTLVTTQIKFMTKPAEPQAKTSLQIEASAYMKNIQNSISRRSYEKRTKKHKLRHDILSQLKNTQKTLEETNNKPSITEPHKESTSEIHQNYTPSFGEDINIYTSFKSFGKNIKTIENNAAKQLADIHSQEDSGESQKLSVIMVNNDTDSVTAEKNKK